MLARRDFLGGCAGSMVLAGCSRRAPRGPEPVVSIVRQPAYTQGIYDNMRRMLSDLKVDARDRKIILKPNLVEFEPGSVINTHPMVVHAALEAFRALGAASVTIAEGPGHRRTTLDIADAAGFFTTIPGFENLFTDLNLDEVSRVHLAASHSKLDSLYLPNTILGADLVVSMPKMKTHHWAGATLSMKNLFGTVPGGVYGWPKNVLHWAGINECIADLHAAVPNQFAIVDGIIGMQGNGPIQGQPKAVGVIVGGRDPVAVDATCCRIMGINPAAITYLTLVADAADFAEQRIRQAGEGVHNVATQFDLLPQFRNLRLASF